jgi:hypothetical protein
LSLLFIRLLYINTQQLKNSWKLVSVHLSAYSLIVSRRQLAKDLPAETNFGGVVFSAVRIVSKESRGHYFPERFVSSCSPAQRLGFYDTF